MYYISFLSIYLFIESTRKQYQAEMETTRERVDSIEQQFRASVQVDLALYLLSLFYLSSISL